MAKIFIDAGHNHSGWNTGAVGNDMREQDITWEVAFLLSEILKNDFDTRLSRPTLEINLGQDNNSAINARWQMSNEWGADYFISIHVNAASGTGAETFFYDRTAQGFAETVQRIYSQEMGLRSRRTELAPQFGVIRETLCPAILIELAFIDSPLHNPDVDILRYKRLEMAQAIANGVYSYMGMAQSNKSEQKPEPQRLTLSSTNISYRGNRHQIQAANVDGSFVAPLSEIAKIFGGSPIGVRAALELAGYSVSWESETHTIVITDA